MELAQLQQDAEARYPYPSHITAASSSLDKYLIDCQRAAYIEGKIDGAAYGSGHMLVAADSAHRAAYAEFMPPIMRSDLDRALITINLIK